MPTSSSLKSRTFYVILNKESGTLKEQWHEGLPEEISNQFKLADVCARILPVVSAGLAGALEEAIAARPDAIIIGGGDGTVSSTARRLMREEIPMGILPFGTFNLAARDLGVPLNMSEAIVALSHASVTQIDVLDVSGQACLCTAVIGFYPGLVARTDEFHGTAWWHKFTQVIGACIRDWHRIAPLALQIETAGGAVLHRTSRFAAAVPGEYEDVFSVIPKRIALSEGKMTLYISRHENLRGLARAAIAYLLGRLKSEREIERITTSAATLLARRKRELKVMIDGEVCSMSLPLQFRVLYRALKVLQPVTSSTS